MNWLFRLAILTAVLLLFRYAWFWFWRAGWKRLAAYFLGTIQNVQNARDDATPSGERRGQLKRDPVCGTHVDTALAVTDEIGGELRYFCSEHCREEFHRRAPASRSGSF